MPEAVVPGGCRRATSHPSGSMACSTIPASSAPGPAQRPVPDDGELPAGLGGTWRPARSRRRRAGAVHFRAAWAAGGRPRADGAEAILDNPRLLRAASQLFDAEVIPNTVAVNVAAHGRQATSTSTSPAFRADRDRCPMQLPRPWQPPGCSRTERDRRSGRRWWNPGAGGAYQLLAGRARRPDALRAPSFCRLRAGRRRRPHVPPDRPDRRSRRRCCRPYRPPPRSASHAAVAGPSASPASPGPLRRP